MVSWHVSCPVLGYSTIPLIIVTCVCVCVGNTHLFSIIAETFIIIIIYNYFFSVF